MLCRLLTNEMQREKGKVGKKIKKGSEKWERNRK